MMVFIASPFKRKRLRPGGRAAPMLLLLLLMAAALSPAASAQQQSDNSSANALIDAFSCQYNCSGNDPLSSLEDLLRSEAQLLSSFDMLLNRTNTTLNETIAFLDSFEDLLRRQTTLYSGFETLLKSQWYRMDCTQQEAFLDSFEDLLKRENMLFSRFNTSVEQNWGSIPREEKVKLLDSLEDLLRRQSKLLRSYEELYMMTNGGLTVDKYVNNTCICRPGQTVLYWFVVKNWCNQTITNVSVVDDHLGTIVHDISLGPMEERTFYRQASLTGHTCNTARARGVGPNGETLVDESNTVCVDFILIKGNNSDSIVVGRQFAFASGSDPPEALNNIEIKKNQKVGDKMLNNTETIYLKGQRASSVANSVIGGRSSNSIKIVTNQE